MDADAIQGRRDYPRPITHGYAVEGRCVQTSRTKLGDKALSETVLIKNATEMLELGFSQPRQVVFGIFDSCFGQLLLAQSEFGISDLLFITSSQEHPVFIGKFLSGVRRRWPDAEVKRNDELLQPLASAVCSGEAQKNVPPLHLKGSRFQLRVWQELLKIPLGTFISYTELASRIGNGRASRAVGSAVGANPVAWLIPCHRVLRKDGGIGGYAFGLAIKRALLKSESATLLT